MVAYTFWKVMKLSKSWFLPWAGICQHLWQLLELSAIILLGTITSDPIWLFSSPSRSFCCHREGVRQLLHIAITPSIGWMADIWLVLILMLLLAWWWFHSTQVSMLLANFVGEHHHWSHLAHLFLGHPLSYYRGDKASHIWPLRLLLVEWHQPFDWSCLIIMLMGAFYMTRFPY